MLDSGKFSSIRWLPGFIGAPVSLRLARNIGRFARNSVHWAEFPRRATSDSGETSMRSMSRLFCSFLLIIVMAPLALRAADPKVELLWPHGAPGAAGTEDADKPTLTIWPAPADKANGCAVVVCPGGGYQHLAVDHEGKQIAEWLNSRGVAAFVLRYRLGPRYHHPVELG